MKFLNALENARLAIKLLLTALLLSFILNVGLSIGLITVPHTMRAYIPPEIPSEGLILKADVIPKSTIYSFAFYIWQSLNYWPTNGVKNYATNIKQFNTYLTPQFHYFLTQDYQHRLTLGELQDRISTLQGLNGSAYSPDDVRYLGHGTWEIQLKLRLTERMNMNDQKIKQAQILYTLRVVRYPVSSTNKWGLALDGFIKNPQRIHTSV